MSPASFPILRLLGGNGLTKHLLRVACLACAAPMLALGGEKPANRAPAIKKLIGAISSSHRARVSC